MSRSKPALAVALAVFASFGFATTQAKAQDFRFNNGGNWGNQRQTDWNIRQGITTQRPGAAVVGSILGGIGRGLGGSNRRGDQVASNILGGIGQGFMIASEPTVWSQGSIRQRNQGYQNNWGSAQFRSAPSPSYGPGRGFRSTTPRILNPIRRGGRFGF